MKNILIVLMILTSTKVCAQVVNIPDVVFKAFLVNHNSPVIDTNGDGEIQNSEAEALSFLHIQTSNVWDYTGLESFTGLDSLIIFLDNHSSLTVPDIPNLRALRIDAFNQSGVDSIFINGCQDVQYLYLEVTPSNQRRLIFTPGNRPRLKYLDVCLYEIESLDLRGCDSLQTLIVSHYDNAVGKLDISGLRFLQHLNEFDRIDSLVARNCVGLESIVSDGFTNLGIITKYLDVSGCTNLARINLGHITAPFLDFSECSAFRDFVTYIPYEVQWTNIKNGRHFERFIPGQCCSQPGGSPINICADDFQIDSITALYNSAVPFPRQLIINSYCSFYPGGAYNTIKGNIKLDLNNNGCTVTDAGMPNVPLRFTDTTAQNILFYSAANGDYRVYTYKGLFTVEPHFPYPYFDISPLTVTIPFDTANSIINTSDFCIRPNGVHNDLDVTFLPVGLARPGFISSYVLTYRNRGNTIMTGNVQLNYDNSKMLFDDASVAPSTQTSGMLTWNFVNLSPFETKVVYIYMNVLPAPVNNLGDTVHYLAVINPLSGDETQNDNSFILPQVLNASFDPNDKICTEGGRIDITEINDYLHYIIRFQNLGTDTAFNIVVADTLTNNYDWESFDFIGSSHRCNVKRVSNKLEFYFENILLPHQAINDAGSNGFIAFRIKPKNSVVIGDSLNNRASIYFDFNLPVETNKTVTVVTNSAGPVPVKLEYFSAVARGDKNVLNWKAACTDASVTFSVERGEDPIHFKSIGTITATNTRCLTPFDFNDVNPFVGKNYYRIKVTDINGATFYSRIVVVGNNKSGLEILAVSNNTIYINADKQQAVQMKLIAADGKLLYSGNKLIQKGSNQLNLPLKNLSTGIYTVVINTGEGEVITRRFLK